MIPVSSNEAPRFVPAVDEAQIVAFLKAALDVQDQGPPSKARMPTLRALHERFGGSYTRLTRIRRKVLAELAPQLASRPAAQDGVLEALKSFNERFDELRGVVAAAQAAAPSTTPAPLPLDLGSIEDRLDRHEEQVQMVLKALARRKRPSATPWRLAAELDEIRRLIASVTDVQAALLRTLRRKRPKRLKRRRRPKHALPKTRRIARSRPRSTRRSSRKAVSQKKRRKRSREHPAPRGAQSKTKR